MIVAQRGGRVPEGWNLTDLVPRLEFDQLEPKLKAQLEARVTRLGYLGEFFKCAGHAPDVLRHFMAMTEALKDALPDRLTEVGALTVACVMGNDYERNQHERLSRSLGFGHDWVRAVNALKPDASPLLSDAEKRVQQYVLAALKRNGIGVDAEFAAMGKAIGPAQAMAVVMLTGRYVTHALAVNTLGLKPPVPSIFADGSEAEAQSYIDRAKAKAKTKDKVA